MPEPLVKSIVVSGASSTFGHGSLLASKVSARVFTKLSSSPSYFRGVLRLDFTSGGGGGSREKPWIFIKTEVTFPVGGSFLYFSIFRSRLSVFISRGSEALRENLKGSYLIPES